MAFQTNNAVQNNNVQPISGNKTDAYVNVYFPLKDGGQIKLGAFALSASKELQKQLLDYITDYGDEALAAIKQRLILDFKRTDGLNGKQLDLG